MSLADETVVHIDRSIDRDQGGPKATAPRGTDDSLSRITNDTMVRNGLGRALTLWLAIGMGVLAALCIGFALYTGMHFLSNIETAAAKAEERERNLFLANEIAKAARTASPDAVQIELAALPEKPKLFNNADALQLMAPLIPATFSSALGLIILVTLTRFVSGFVLSDRKDPPKDSDYGAIAALVQEVVAAVKALRGKD